MSPRSTKISKSSARAGVAKSSRARAVRMARALANFRARRLGPALRPIERGLDHGAQLGLAAPAGEALDDVAAAVDHEERRQRVDSEALLDLGIPQHGVVLE